MPLPPPSLLNWFYDCILLSMQLSCQIQANAMVGPVDGMQVCQFLPLLFISLIFLLSLSLSLPLLLYKLVCLANSLPSSLCSCSPFFFIFVLYLSSYSSLSFDLPPHFYLCSSAFKFKLIWWWSRWQHVGATWMIVLKELYNSDTLVLNLNT